MSEDFFKNLKGITEFEAACRFESYYPLPMGWSIIVTDIQGSTKAIEQGRYKDVNMVGAACITAAVNMCKGIDLPYVFGGDGATILVPERYVEKVTDALLAVKKMSKNMYDLDLRVGVVPIVEITNRGESFNVAKYVTSTGCALAMFKGGGAALADHLVKNEGFSVERPDHGKDPDLEGLSCRWQPVKSQKGMMLTLLVMARCDQDDMYQQINSYIHGILNGQINPLDLKGMSYAPLNKKSFQSSAIVWRQKSAKYKKALKHGFEVLFFTFANRFNLKLGGFDVVQYRRDMIANSDYRKFDDMLRMVVDCSAAQVNEIEGYLEKLYKEGKVFYGIHKSDTALMTCFVPSLASDGHIHFVDGNDGGYAIAAKQLKQQMKSEKKAA